MEPGRYRSVSRAILFSLLTPLLLLACCYTPAFVIVAALKPGIAAMIPIVIGASFVSAAVLIAVIGWRSQQLPADFGLRFSDLRTTALTAAIALPVAAAIGWGLQVAHERTPFDLSHFPLALLLLYFGLAAPIQEESIFRGLIQSVLRRELMKGNPASPGYEYVASAASALWFGVLHLSVGPFTACAAVVLGLIAAEARRRSQSLVPAIVAHSIFNLSQIVFS
jgi:membrane protease YdiL (CAAX protease family)